MAIPAALLGATVALWSLLSEDSGTRGTALPVREVGSRAVDSPARPDGWSSGSGEARELPAEGAPPLDAGHSPTIVRVVRKADASAIPSATVRLWRFLSSQIGEDELPLAGATEVGGGTTDSEGRLVTEVPTGPGEFAIRGQASAPGFAPSAALVRVGEGRPVTLTIALEPAGHVAGVVLDAGGVPVPRVRVAAVESGLPAEVVSLGAACVNGRTWSRTESDGQGRFAFPDLRVGALYSMTAIQDGWSSPSPTLVRIAGSNDEIRIRVDAVRGFRVRIVDAQSKLPVSPLHVSFSVIGEARVLSSERLLPLVYWSGSEWTSSLASTDDPGLHEFVIRLRDASQVPVRVRLLIADAEGYRPVTTHVNLRMPGDLRTAPIDEVELERTSPVETGSIVVAEGDSESIRFLHPWRMLRFQQDGAWSFRRGRPAESGSWRFDNVPVGRREFAIGEGVAWSRAATADILAREAVRLAVSYPPLSALEIEARDAEGRPVHGFNVVVAKVESDPAAARTYLHNTSSSDERRWGRESVVLVVPSGRHSVVVTLPGFQPYSVVADVRAGETARVVAELPEGPR